MAEVITKEQLENARVDAKDLGECVHGNESGVVTPRIGDPYPTLPAAIAAVENKGGYISAPTLAALNVIVPEFNHQVARVDESGDEYRWDPSVTPLAKWVPTGKNWLNAAKTYVSNNGDAKLISLVNSNINYTTIDRLLNFANTIYVVTPTNRYNLTVPTSVSLPSNTIYRLEYNIASNSIRAVAYNAVKAENWLVLGFVTVDASGISTSDFYYTINGSVVGVSQSEYGELINTVPSRIAFDTVAKTLSITSAVRLLSAGYTHVPSSTVTVDFPTSSGSYSLVFNKTNKTFLFKGQSTVSAQNDVVLAYVTFAATTFIPTVTGISSYSIDGASVDKYADLKTLYDVEIIQTTGSFVNFDFKNSKITIPVLRVVVGGSTATTIVQELDISTNTTSWHKLMYNRVTKLFSVKLITSGVVDSLDEAVAGYFLAAEKRVYGVSKYAIDGELVKGFREPIRDAGFRVPYGNVTSAYKGRTLSELNTLYTSIGTDLNAFYALYDDLAATYPTYITKTDLGSDKDGNKIYQYQFNAPDIANTASSSKKPKIIILSNIHGWEKACTYILYKSLKEVCEQWENNESLEALRWGANLIVVPVINPSGFISSDRKNSNGVDIERNFPSGWVQGSPADETYGGSAPLSEPEAVIINNLLANNLDAVHFMSCHSFSSMSNSTFPNGVWCWIPSATEFGVNLAKSTIVKNSIEDKKRYPFISTDYVGYADKGAPAGSAAYHSTVFHNIQGATFEINGRMYWEPNQPFLSEAVVTCGSDLLINWLLMNIKYATELYNSRINI